MFVNFSVRKSFIKILLERRIPQILGSYFIAGTSLIFFIQYLVDKYQFPFHYPTLALFGLIGILPSVIILSYFHGAPGKDEWTKVEKYGVPTNIIFLLVILLVGFRSDWWIIKDNKSGGIKNYFIHFTSDNKYIQDYNWFDKDVYVINSIPDSTLNTIKKSVFSKVTPKFQYYPEMQFELSRSQDDYNIINQLPRPRELAQLFYSHKPTTLDSLKIEIENESISIYLNIQDRVKKQYGFIPEVLMTVYIYKVTSINDNEPERMFFDFITYWDHLPGKTMGSKPHNTIDELIDDLSEALGNVIIQRSLGGLVGIVSEILEDDMIKINLHKHQYLKRGMKLESSSLHEWKKDGHEKWMEDLQLIMQWMENDTAAMDSEIYNKRLEEYESISDGSTRYYHDSNQGYYSYHVELIDVTDSIAIAKIIWKSFPLLKIRPGDRFTME